MSTPVKVILAVVGGLLLLGGLGVGCLQSLMKGEAYDLAMARAQQDPKVVEALGAPLTAAFWITGSVSSNSEGGRADLQIPVTGPKGTGVIAASAVKGGGNWGLNSLQVRVDATGKVIAVRIGGH